MKKKELYKKVNHKEYCKITNIQEPAQLKSSLDKFVQKDLFLGLIIFMAMFIVFSLIIKIGIKTLLVSLGLFALLFILSLLNNTFKILVKDDKITINKYLKKDEIKCGDLCNVYIQRKKYKFSYFIPVYFYNLVFIYKENEEVYEYTLPTYMMLNKDIINFFKHFEIEELEVQAEEDEKNAQEEKIKKIFTIVAIVVVLLIIIVSGIVVTLNK